MPRETHRPALFAGENPIIRLVRPGTDQFVAAASYWRADYAPEGNGSVLLFWADDGPPDAIYTDNPALAKSVTSRFNQHFNGFKDRGFGAIEPQAAQFAGSGDGRGSMRVVCTAGSTVIELAWDDPVDSFQSRSDSNLGGVDYVVENVMCPVARASITVNGSPLAGELLRASAQESSAFLAFAESWGEA